MRLRRLWRRLHHTQRACALFQRKARAEVGNSSASAYGTVRETHCSPAAQIPHVAIQRNPVLMVQFWPSMDSLRLTRREFEALYEWVLRERRALSRSSSAA